jgi:hypothetical protein
MSTRIEENVSNSRDVGPYVGVRIVLLTVVRHPELWLAALIQGFRLGRPGWWRRFPPVPAPTESLWHLRMLTAYGGDGTATPDPDDVARYLEWCRASRSWRKR